MKHAAYWVALRHANPDQGFDAVQQDSNETETENLPAEVAKEGEHIPAPASTSIKLPEGASVSYADLGRKRAKEIAGLDEKIAETRTTLRADVLKVLEGAPDAAATYISGFTAEMADREAKGKDIRSLRNVKSQVQRVFNAYKAHPEAVLTSLKNSGKRWDVLLKELPKRSNAGRPASETGQPEAEKGGEMASNIETATDSGAMIQTLDAVAARLKVVANGKDQPYAEYVAMKVLAAMKAARDEFAAAYAKHKGGPDDGRAAIRAELKMDAAKVAEQK